MQCRVEESDIPEIDDDRRGKRPRIPLTLRPHSQWRSLTIDLLI